MRILLTADAELAVPPLLYGGIERVIDLLIREYLAAGLPVVYNPGIGDLDELLAGVGVAVPRFDLDSYTRAVNELCCLTSQGSGIIQACRDRAERQLSLSAGARAYGEVYNQFMRAR